MDMSRTRKRPSPTESRPPTLRDIADTVGVDTSTVSKVIGGAEIRVSEATRRAILAEAARRNYQPHAAARSLKAGRTGALGMFLPDFTNPLYASIVRGAVRRAGELGYVVLVAGLAEGSRVSTYRRLIGERRIDVLIIATAEDMTHSFDHFNGHQIPHVYVNRRVAGAGRSVITDDEKAATLAANYLIERGHVHLGFVGGDDSVDTASRRRAGFKAACAAAGVELVDVVRPYSRRGGYDAASELLAKPGWPTGVFASNMLCGIGFLAGAHALGVAVPRQLSVISLDGEDAPYTEPPMTAVRLPVEEMGARAVEELDRVLNGEATTDVIIASPPELVVRGSVAARPRH
jgi:LacI family transcriptional regulator